MFCKNCGKSLGEGEDICSTCGYCNVDLNDLTPQDLQELANAVNNQQNNQPQQVQQPQQNQQAQPVQQQTGTSKKGLGLLLGFFTGIIGLIIGICLFQNDYERKTFINGWLTAFFIGLGLAVLSLIIYFAFIGSLINSFSSL